MYWFCQFAGSISLWGIVSIVAFQQNPEETGTLPKFLENCVLTILLSHFIVRRMIKANSSYASFNIKVYAKAILLASIAYYVIETANDMLFPVLSENVDPTESLSEIYRFFLRVLSCIFLFIGWSACYLSLTSIRDSKLLAQELKEAQLSSLMNQVNPHFLFNSLNTIRGMIFEDQEKAAELVTQLSSLFRYNLSLDTRVTATFAEELTICQQFLAIEAIRLGDRLKVQYHIDEGCQQRVIPAMGLLTLVENAVKHGIANMRSGGVLTIRATLNQDALVVEVLNPYDPALVKSGTQVGLQNLRQRIRLLKGEQGSLIQHADEQFFHVVMTLAKEA